MPKLIHTLWYYATKVAYSMIAALFTYSALLTVAKVVQEQELET